MFCIECISDVMEASPSPICPLCREEIDEASLVKVPAVAVKPDANAVRADDSAKVDEEEFQHSAKVSGFYNNLYTYMQLANRI